MTRKNRLAILKAVLIMAFILGLFLIWEKRSTFKIVPDQTSPTSNQEKIAEQTSGPKSPISGIACENAQSRPIAVMLSNDSEARPLSGIGQADIVFEMEVVKGSITRPMAVYICNTPEQIGSVRSARQDFIPLAKGLDAIYVHWGGSHFALDILKTNIIDNLDALANPYSTFYRQSNIVAPYNGFTSIVRVMSVAQKLGFDTQGNFVGYSHLPDVNSNDNSQEKKILNIGYAGEFRVSYQYDPQTNSYFRYRGGTKEIDKNTGQQVETKNIVLMRAVSQELEGQYNTVQVQGTGAAEFYLNGEVFQGTWKKDKNDEKNKLFFYDEKGQEIKFVPGSIWVEIVDPGLSVTWK